MTTASLKPEGPFAEVRNGMATWHHQRWLHSLATHTPQGASAMGQHTASSRKSGKTVPWHAEWPRRAGTLFLGDDRIYLASSKAPKWSLSDDN